MNDIRAALTDRLQQLPGLPEVAWENVSYKPTIGTPYLRPWLLPAEPHSAGLGDAAQNVERGVYQISLFYPVGKGTKDIYAMATDLRSHFKRGIKLNYNGQLLTITKSYPSPMQQDSDWLHLPMNIAFYAYTEN